MGTIGLEEGLKLREVSPDLYEATTRPWTWPFTRTVPGPVLMGLAAAAAYETVALDFAIDCFQAYFLAAPNPDRAFQMRVQRVNDGGRFTTRSVSVEQGGTAMVAAMCTFVRPSTLKGHSMQHVAKRASKQTVSAITLDDLEHGRGRLGSYMKFQRLPLVYTGPDPKPDSPPPESFTYTSVAQIAPPINSDSRKLHALGIIVLSDYHVMDAVPTMHGVTIGIPKINDTTLTRTENPFERSTTLNHTVHFHVHDGFRADDLCYIEANTPWANSRRGEVQTRIFERQGRLIATCLQEAYYVFREKKDSKI